MKRNTLKSALVRDQDCLLSETEIEVAMRAAEAASSGVWKSPNGNLSLHVDASGDWNGSVRPVRGSR